jgi:hypothetical protein
LALVTADKLDPLSQGKIGPVDAIRIVAVVGAEEAVETRFLAEVHFLWRIPLGKLRLGHI